MNALEANHPTCGAPAPGAVQEIDPPRGATSRLDCIATAALHHALARGFIRGYEEEDWICAEAQVLAEMYGLTGFSS